MRSTEMLSTVRWASLMIALAAMIGHASASFPLPGEWPCDRRTETRQARSPLPGRITKPNLAWKHFAGVNQTFVVLTPNNAGGELMVPAGPVVGERTHWRQQAARFKVTVPMSPEDILADNTSLTAYGDILEEIDGLEKFECDSGFNLPTIHGQWQDGACRCYKRQENNWVQIWETSKFLMFRPSPIIGDFDSDGQAEVAIVPWGALKVYDGRTGQVEGEVAFTPGRSYGFFGVYDLDGNGNQEFVVMADFAKHIDVLGYQDGELKLLWQHNIELVIDNPQKILRVHPDPVADVEGNGQMDLLVNLYNDTGDGRWHLLVLDGMTGAVKADLPNEFMQGKIDVNGDGAVELLTVQVDHSGLPDYGAIRVRSLKGPNPTTLWEANDAAWQTWDIETPPHVNTGAHLGKQDVMIRQETSGTFVALRYRVPGDPKQMRACVATWDGGAFRVRHSMKGTNLTLLGMDEYGAMLASCNTNPGQTSRITAQSGRLEALAQWQPLTLPATVTVARQNDPPQATIAVQGHGEQLVLLHGPANDQPPREVSRIDGRGQSWSWPNVNGPVFADLRGDGRRQILFARSATGGEAQLVAADLDGNEIWSHNFSHIPGAPPIWNRGGMLYWQVGHYTDPQCSDVLVTVRRSMMHSEEVILLSGKDGTPLWRRDRQLAYRSVAGLFAVADFNGNGLADVAGSYPSLFYILRGSTGENLIAMDASWPEVPGGTVYWANPIAGDFDGDGSNEVLYMSRLMRGSVRPDGTLAWFHEDTMDHCPSALPALGDTNGDGRIEVIDVGYPDGIHCYTAHDGKELWRLPHSGSGSGMASADIDGDERDEALFVDQGNTIVCVGTTEDGKTGTIHWTMRMPTDIGPLTIADINGQGLASILVMGSNGYVYCIE